ncbi:MAG: formylmethanofuran dehydrogenase subunit E family protein [Deltaproteobacteria bacterium]|nr:formylmethanofuran dehydrogenase subunit E family protein [Deltaproteobacteria bacterium]MBW2052618.1 formylmethanofuran dehydrogenase subunit E family protein [Deltaproteobacteria bacterium]MBW2142331.1 formylmethanofuran dehydrogenase subunit E family protein [Deltaproteobacteria bacterium]MBW2324116.1 formylmethanofuran dehydrogenase subunit E family protein [Deltaproteobacteria bacterium]
MIGKLLSVSLISGVILLSLMCYSPNLYAHEKHHLDPRKPVCLKKYPTDPVQFNAIVQPYVNKIIQAHGLEEWKAVLLTNEMHRHLGLWSIIGAKMGIRAREVLDAPFDHLDVVSFCGYKPPFSCTIDGLQVSTGASLGRATISNTHLGLPEAIFIYKKRKLYIKVKPEVKLEIRRVIRELSGKYGFQSSRYFQELDKVSVKYWLDWDRNKIFQEIHF